MQDFVVLRYDCYLRDLWNQSLTYSFYDMDNIKHLKILDIIYTITDSDSNKN